MHLFIFLNSPPPLLSSGALAAYSAFLPLQGTQENRAPQAQIQNRIKRGRARNSDYQGEPEIGVWSNV